MKLKQLKLLLSCIGLSAISQISVWAALLKLLPPNITVQPASQTVDAGSSASFLAVASGPEPLAYQWRRNGIDLSGQITNRLDLANVQPAQAGDYTVVATHEGGAVTSQVATLTVYVPAVLTMLTQRWTFNPSGADLGTAWKEASYDDSTWPEDSALFYHEIAGQPLPQGTRLALTNESGEPIITYYFRTRFNFAGTSGGLSLLATNYAQHGAVFYLNGVELGRLRLPSGRITASSQAFVGPPGQPDILLFPAGALLCGDNVLAVEVHQQIAAATNLAPVFGMALRTTAHPPPMPDLIVWPPRKPHIELCTFNSAQCEVVEGCSLPGTRRLLRFEIETRNIGTGDLILGNPATNSYFVFASCHNHYHFDGYVGLHLMNSNEVVAVGSKISFALEDVFRWDTNAPLDSPYKEDYQGIQPGWADIYNYWIPCQYIDITDTPAGLYTLELEVDPDHKLAELNDANNVTRISVEIPPDWAPCGTPPPNDNFADALVVPYAVASVVANSECATREPDEPPILSGLDELGQFSVWFRWTAPANGNVTFDTEDSNFPPLLCLYSGGELSTLTLIADDVMFDFLPKSITASVTAGTTYAIVVDGFYDLYGASNAVNGEVVLNINANGNDLFADAQPLPNPAGTITGTTRAATKEPGEPDHAGLPGGHSIWYSWTAPFAGAVTFDTLGSRFDTLLAIYTGTSLDTLAVVPNSFGPVLHDPNRVTFDAVAGTTYRIAVDGRDGQTGLCTLNWHPAIRLTSPVVAPGIVQFTLFAQAGESCLIETSADLVTWSPWVQVTNAAGSLTLTDSPVAGHKFYRTRQQHP